MTPELLNIDHIHVYVQNRQAAELWYQQVLGLTRVSALAGWADNGGPLTLANASGSIHLALFEREARDCRSTIAFAVSADAFFRWQQHLSQLLGQSVEVIDHQLSWSLYFRDPDHNPYEITCYQVDAVRAALAQQALAPG